MKRPPLGFSLIETMIVLVIVTILMSLLSLNLSFLQAGYAQHELSLFHSRLHALQQTAIVTGKSQSMAIVPGENSYYWDGQPYKLPKTLRFGIKQGIRGPPSHPSHEITNPVTFSENTIIFHPDGIIKPGTLYLLDHRQQLYALSCGVGHVSFLRKYRYDGAWKLIDT